MRFKGISSLSFPYALGGARVEHLKMLRCADLRYAQRIAFKIMRRKLPVGREGVGSRHLLQPATTLLALPATPRTKSIPDDALGIRCPRSARYRLCALGNAYGQLDDKPGPAEGRLAVGPNDPVVRFDDRPGDRQAQTHAALLGRKETVEQTRQVLRIDAGAAVFDDAAYRLRIDLPRANGYAPLRDFQLGHGLYCIDDEVHDNLLQLGTVHPHLREIRRQIERD